MNEAIIQQIEYRLIECGIHRIISCIDRLTDDQIQYRPNSNCNSINNQILHLNGNVRQWLIASMSTQEDVRQRDEEFNPENKMPKDDLMKILESLEQDVRSTFPIILNSDLTELKSVQCYNESIFSIIVHVIEHFSYHLGQITYITKMLLDVDTGYYADMGLDKVN